MFGCRYSVVSDLRNVPYFVKYLWTSGQILNCIYRKQCCELFNLFYKFMKNNLDMQIICLQTISNRMVNHSVFFFFTFQLRLWASWSLETLCVLITQFASNSVNANVRIKNGSQDEHISHNCCMLEWVKTHMN